ncbi:MAG: hypothetical protein GX206_05315 [Clostridiales bacterium]|nr:hypothetical protein [Clostridiales bacterium]
MNQYIKPNLVLPISLHDAVITSIEIAPATSELIDGTLTFKFSEGFYLVEENKVEVSGEATLKFTGIDFDFSSVYYCKENERQEVTFADLARDANMYRLEVVDETYGFNQSKFGCSLFKEDFIYWVEIEIYHFNETIYEWKNAI